MTVASLLDPVRLPRLLAGSPQVAEWAAELHRMADEGRTVAVAHSPDRRTEAVRMAARYGGPAVTLDRIPALPHLHSGDLLAVVSGTGRPRRGPGGLHSLHLLLARGVVIWGLTGPRPNALSHFCHDVLAVPTTEPDLLLRCHRLVVDRLVARPGNVARMTGRRRSSGT